MLIILIKNSILSNIEINTCFIFVFMNLHDCSLIKNMLHNELTNKDV